MPHRKSLILSQFFVFYINMYGVLWNISTVKYWSLHQVHWLNEGKMHVILSQSCKCDFVISSWYKNSNMAKKERNKSILLFYLPNYITTSNLLISIHKECSCMIYPTARLARNHFISSFYRRYSELCISWVLISN